MRELIYEATLAVVFLGSIALALALVRGLFA